MGASHYLQPVLYCTKGFTHHFGFLFIYFQAFILKALIPFPQFFFHTSSSSHFPTNTRSSAYSISHGRPSLTLCVTASITIMKSSGLSTEPWYTPTFTPNHSLTDPPYGSWHVYTWSSLLLLTTLQHLTSLWPTQLLSLALCQRPSQGLQMPTTVPCVFLYISLVTVLQ